ncbi:dihydrodipicolinate reductase [Mobilisporobacter senegalensis]|uniref:4-hydroxy-tetrahydrodipicolinate reductase n=1 Tax=Mobilisporobacter senegalensis TaxID=1329262 RepID=A0A3N1XY30_9FIRM|nr:4-hydroxy-tetrahydrodipicolinate reductase [Mobilisporobacter senegalensis]ROR31504.1 dihydrodipicolinate reductase [Mobilisporobacter senegalensis]
MTRIIMHGCNGSMGQVISELARQDENVHIVAGIDLSGNKNNYYPVFNSVAECDIEADVIIDFSSAAAADKLLKDAVKKKIPIVLCTTGLSSEQIESIQESSKKIAILKSANMSLGVNTLLKLLQTATKVLNGADFDIEIVEKHHNRKIDAPSGTALALADAINEVLNNEYAYQYDRSALKEKRNKKEIGISAVRGGTIVGEHEVIFAGVDEVIEFKHTAYSKAIFAKGAISAAKFLGGKEPGMYDMSHVIG